MTRTCAEAVIIGGGPAGCVAARLLASWGHAVVLVTRAPDPARGLAESIPPSARRLLSEVGVLEDVERAGFYRTTGNTVWWGSQEKRVETFADAPGYQVFRPDLDAVFLASARAAGVRAFADARVRSVTYEGERATVVCGEDDDERVFDAGVVLDCSGRAGVIARRFRRQQDGFRTYALVGVWRRSGGWNLPDPSHTTVETIDHGWVWSVPVSTDVRHVAVMGDATSPRPMSGVALEARYLDEVHRAAGTTSVVDGAALQHAFACDASLYWSERYSGPRFLLVGDAGSFIDPLSSFGVKKALGSAWVAAVAAHTALIDPARAGIAFAFFDEWERRLYQEYLRQSREFARSAFEAHPHPFWAARASVVVPEPEVDAAQVRTAFDRIRGAETIAFSIAGDVRLEPRPIIRGREIVVERSFRGPRFHEHVDLVALADVACRHRSVPEVCEAYCRRQPPAPLPNLLAGLSLLVATGVLQVETPQRV